MFNFDLDYLVYFAVVVLLFFVGVALAAVKSKTAYDEEGEEKNSKKTDEEMRKDYEMMIENEKLQEKRNAMNKIVKSSGFILIPLPVFLYFKRQLRKKEA
jgi:hypothetical protein